ncbi:hypothetical protein J6590_008843 [Homalodisca vitripennis]|nr:hypothetical protein J6590_008843 [Homalodisca vitripennis]
MMACLHGTSCCPRNRNSIIGYGAGSLRSANQRTIYCQHAITVVTTLLAQSAEYADQLFDFRSLRSATTHHLLPTRDHRCYNFTSTERRVCRPTLRFLRSLRSANQRTIYCQHAITVVTTLLAQSAEYADQLFDFSERRVCRPTLRFLRSLRSANQRTIYCQHAITVVTTLLAQSAEYTDQLLCKTAAALFVRFAVATSKTFLKSKDRRDGAARRTATKTHKTCYCGEAYKVCRRGHGVTAARKNQNWPRLGRLTNDAENKSPHPSLARPLPGPGLHFCFYRPRAHLLVVLTLYCHSQFETRQSHFPRRPRGRNRIWLEAKRMYNTVYRGGPRGGEEGAPTRVDSVFCSVDGEAEAAGLRS